MKTVPGGRQLMTAASNEAWRAGDEGRRTGRSANWPRFLIVGATIVILVAQFWRFVVG